MTPAPAAQTGREAEEEQLLQRKEQAEAAQTERAPATPRESLEDTIYFWDQGREHFDREIDQDLLATLLDAWLGMMNDGWRLIDEELDGDAELLDRLKESYRAAVSALIGRASGDLGVSEQELYAQQNPRIAWWLRRQVAPRESIVFILGGRNDDFYDGAIEFYQLSQARIVGDRRSLLQVRDWLAANPPANGLPWGDVDIVAHASFEGTMKVPLAPGGERVKPSTLRQAIESQEFRPLPDEVVDDATRIVIRGCALGRNREMLELLRSAFGGNEESPDVYAPIHLQTYKYRPVVQQGQVVTVAEEYLEEFWYVGFPEKARGDKAPSDARLAELFAAKYPGTYIDWRAMLGDPDARERIHRSPPQSHIFPELYQAPPEGRAGAGRLTRIVKAEFEESKAWTDIEETSRWTATDGLVTIEFSFRDGDDDERTGYTIPTLMPEVSTQSEYRTLLNLQDNVLAVLRTLEEGSNLSADDFHWKLERKPNKGALTADYKFTGGRGLVRIKRDLLEPTEGLEGPPGRARPNISDPSHFSHEGPADY